MSAQGPQAQDPEAQLQQAVLLKNVVDAKKDLCKDVNFDCRAKGIQASVCKDVNFDCREKEIQERSMEIHGRSMDSSHVPLVYLLQESAIQEFKCRRPTSQGMNVDPLVNILKMCGSSDSLNLQWQSGVDTGKFQCED